MFGIFQNNKKKSLEKKYAKLLEESHRLSHVNRKASDLKLAEANEILKALEEMESVS